MAEISKHIDTEKDLAIYEVNGDLSNEELFRLTNDILTGQTTVNTILDFTTGSFKKIQTDVLKKAISDSKSRNQKRKEIKVAILAKKDIDFGMGRMYAAYIEMENIGIKIGVFRTRFKVLKWFGLE